MAKVAVGAIRYDAWYDNGPDTVASASADVLSNIDYQFRSPKHAVRDKPRVIKFNPTQASFDEEIRIAALAGLSYWAFLRYAPAHKMSYGLEALYQGSSIKSALPWCSIQYPYLLGSTGNYTAQVNATVQEFLQPHYFKVMGNRPLFYILSVGNLTTFGGDNATGRANFKAMLDALRAATVAAGLGSPYIVLMMDQSVTLAYYTDFGADAVSAYAYGMGQTRKSSFAAQTARCRSYWTQFTNLGAPFIPTCMAGWDPRPQYARPLGFAAPAIAYEGMDKYVVAATGSELAAHIQSAIDFVNANPGKCPANCVVIYAENEFSEGGYLGRTIDDTNPNGTKYSAITSTLKQGA